MQASQDLRRVFPDQATTSQTELVSFRFKGQTPEIITVWREEGLFSLTLLKLSVHDRCDEETDHGGKLHHSKTV